MADQVSFEADAISSAPAGWTVAKTGRGEPRWTVETDQTAPFKTKVVQQSGHADYPLLFRNGTAVKDGFVEVKFNAVSGSEDRAGGLVWRAKDANNVFVHISVAERAGLRGLDEGQRLAMKVVTTQKGREAAAISLLS
jgi:cold shock CspA family protein